MFLEISVLRRTLRIKHVRADVYLRSQLPNNSCFLPVTDVRLPLRILTNLVMVY